MTITCKPTRQPKQSPLFPVAERMQDTTPPSAQEPLYIPLPYRILLLYVEPVFALNGAVLCVLFPSLFLNTFSPNLRYSFENQIIYDQLAATYCLFAFNQAVVLRITSDLRVWKAIILGILICDVVHFWAGMKLMVRDGNTAPWGWRPEDWVAVLSLVVPGAMRVAFLYDIGLKKSGGRKKVGKRAS